MGDGMKLGDTVRPREEYRPHADLLIGTIQAMGIGRRDGIVHLDVLLDSGCALGGVPAREWEVIAEGVERPARLG